LNIVSNRGFGLWSTTSICHLWPWKSTRCNPLHPIPS